MPASREPIEQPRFGRRQVAIGDADRLKAERPAPLLDLRRERRVIHASAS
jgi:hypothetical protein